MIYNKYIKREIKRRFIMQVKISKTNLKNSIKQLGISSLATNNLCIGFFHEVSIPEELKKMKSELCNIPSISD